MKIFTQAQVKFFIFGKGSSPTESTTGLNDGVIGKKQTAKHSLRQSLKGTVTLY